MPPTADELRLLIKKYWLEHLDASKRENADDEEFLDPGCDRCRSGL
jgi:hypothetical protein